MKLAIVQRLFLAVLMTGGLAVVKAPAEAYTQLPISSMERSAKESKDLAQRTIRRIEHPQDYRNRRFQGRNYRGRDHGGHNLSGTPVPRYRDNNFRERGFRDGNYRDRSYRGRDYRNFGAHRRFREAPPPPPAHPSFRR